MLKVMNVRLPVGADESGLVDYVAKSLRVGPGDIQTLRILRKSLDVRDKARLEHVFTTAVAVADETAVLRRLDARTAAPYAPTEFELPETGPRLLHHRPIVVGAGPAGLFAAFQLAEMGYAPLLLERGPSVTDRIPEVKAFDDGGPLDPENNYLFGEGGAGAFSDGKLTCRNQGPDTDRVLAVVAAHKGKPSIVYDAKPHLGSNRLPSVVKALRRAIVEAGGEVRFGCRVEDLLLAGDGTVLGVETTQGPIPAEVVVLANGHSARDTYEMLVRRGVALEAKP
ncbi:MAG: NAD(P)/FAD-dependent oxidoreductase, partial [Planctomycetia bacterium]